MLKEFYKLSEKEALRVLLWTVLYITVAAVAGGEDTIVLQHPG